MHTILVPYCDDDLADSALDTALTLADRYKSHVEGLHAWRTPQIIAGEGVVFPTESLARLADEGRQFARAARERFNRRMSDRGIAFRGVSEQADAVTCGWREGEGIESEIVGDYGRIFDLIVIGRTVSGTTADWKTTVEAGLFESGRPVLLAPAKSPTTVGRHIVIAWNCATETARTIAAAYPLLQDAEQITVLTVEGGTVQGPSGEEIASHLRRRGLACTAVTRRPQNLSIGDTMVAEAVNMGGDLLLKGAFTNSRVRQMIFGGATRDIINGASLPVLLAH